MGLYFNRAANEIRVFSRGRIGAIIICAFYFILISVLKNVDAKLLDMSANYFSFLIIVYSFVILLILNFAYSRLIRLKISLDEKTGTWFFGFPLRAFSRKGSELGALEKIIARPVLLFGVSRFSFEFKFKKETFAYLGNTSKTSFILWFYTLLVSKEGVESIGKFFNVPVEFQ